MSLHKEIAGRAYELYEEGGMIHGHDLDHWLEAEGSLGHSHNGEKRPARASTKRTAVKDGSVIGERRR